MLGMSSRRLVGFHETPTLPATALGRCWVSVIGAVADAPLGTAVWDRLPSSACNMYSEPKLTYRLSWIVQRASGRTCSFLVLMSNAGEYCLISSVPPPTTSCVDQLGSGVQT